MTLEVNSAKVQFCFSAMRLARHHHEGKQTKCFQMSVLQTTRVFVYLRKNDVEKITHRQVWGNPGPHLTYGSLGIHETTTQTACQSVQSFLWVSRLSPTDRYTDAGLRYICSNRSHSHIMLCREMQPNKRKENRTTEKRTQQSDLHVDTHYIISFTRDRHTFYTYVNGTCSSLSHIPRTFMTHNQCYQVISVNYYWLTFTILVIKYCENVINI